MIDYTIVAIGTFSDLEADFNLDLNTGYPRFATSQRTPALGQTRGQIDAVVLLKRAEVQVLVFKL